MVKEMVFPDTDRVIYQNNPLVEVLCQIRFPAILRIKKEIPSDFQDQLRADYPIFEERQFLPSLEGKDIPPEAIQAILEFGNDSAKTYEFRSADHLWKVTLASSFIALTTSSYRRWENFRQRLSAVLEALELVYQPAFYDRIGLRYQDIVDRGQLGIQEVHWPNLLRREIAAELGAEGIADSITGATHRLHFRLDQQGGKLTLAHGLVKKRDTQAIGYMIDADFYTDERTEVSDVYGKLDRYNREAGRLFRWCITEQLHRAMGPTTVR